MSRGAFILMQEVVGRRKMTTKIYEMLPSRFEPGAASE